MASACLGTACSGIARAANAYCCRCRLVCGRLAGDLLALGQEARTAAQLTPVSALTKINRLTKGKDRRVMYLESKAGTLGGAHARIGRVEFSKTGRTVYYRERSLKAIGGRGIRGNFIDEESGEEFWVSGVKVRGSNVHPSESSTAVVDDDARNEYARLRREG